MTKIDDAAFKRATDAFAIYRAMESARRAEAAYTGPERRTGEVEVCIMCSQVLPPLKRRKTDK